MIYLFIISLITPVAVFFSYRQGLKDGKQIDEGEPLKPVIKKPTPKKKLTDDERKAQILLDNINNYDGTNRNQKEVK